MLGTPDGAERARWEVLWIKDKKIQHKNCGCDLVEAMRIYEMVRDAGRPGATLRCCNFGFPPPEDLQPRIVRAKKNGRVGEFRLVPMKAKNAEGIYWCPYCMKMRRFVRRSMAEIDGHRIRDVYFGCPMCATSHRDHNARKWNPLLIKIGYELEAEAVRAPARTTQSRRAARRRKQRREA